MKYLIILILASSNLCFANINLDNLSPTLSNKEIKIKRNFDDQVKILKAKLELSCQSGKCDSVKIADSITSVISRLENPVVTNLEVLNKIFCIPRSFNFLDNDYKSDFEYRQRIYQRGLPNSPPQLILSILTCKNEKNEIFTRGLTADSTSRGGYRLAEFLYLLNKKQSNLKSWFEKTLYEIINLKIEKSENKIIQSEIPDLILEQDLVNFIKERVSRINLTINERLTIYKKTDSFAELVKYDLNKIAYSLERALTSVDIPKILVEIKIGNSIVIDKSSFSSVIGSYSYPMQLLFYQDSWADFFNRGSGEFPALSGFGTNVNWYLWADMVAGNDSERTLRDTRYFRNLLIEANINY